MKINVTLAQQALLSKLSLDALRNVGLRLALPPPLSSVAPRPGPRQRRRRPALLSSFALALRLLVKCHPFVAIFVDSPLDVVGLSCTAFDALGDRKRGLSLTYMQAISTRPGGSDDHCTPDRYMHKTGHPDHQLPISRRLYRRGACPGNCRSRASMLQLGVDDDADIPPCSWEGIYIGSLVPCLPIRTIHAWPAPRRARGVGGRPQAY